MKVKEHWDNIYGTKKPEEVSWTQAIPAISLEFIHQLKVPVTASVIDIGGGDSTLVDYLLKEGYTDLTVLDISEAAIKSAQERLGDAASRVNWIVGDMLDFKPERKYKVWHDRAAFHFQTDPQKVDRYLSIMKKAVDGIVIIGTFSTDGPSKCSGLDVQQYDESSMKKKFEAAGLKNIECKREDHITPAGAVQNFVFCSFMN